MFLYYALIGLNNPKNSIKVYSLNVLGTIAQHNAESILELTEKVHLVCKNGHWEIKAQAMLYAITILTQFKHMSHVIGQKSEEIKSAAAKREDLSMKPGAGERNSLKGNLLMAVDIIQNCFNLDAPKSVQKIGLFQLQTLLPDYKMLYPIYTDVLSQTDEDIKELLLQHDNAKTPEEIFYSFGNNSFNYRLRSDNSNYDYMHMTNSLIDLIQARELESLKAEHMQIFAHCLAKLPQANALRVPS